MNYWRFVFGLFATASLLLIALPVTAQGLSIQPRATIGYEYYDFDGEDDGTSNQLGDFNFKSDYLIGGLGLTVQTGRFFADLYGQKNLSDAEFVDNDFVGVAGLDLDEEAERFNVNLALGYAITPSISVIGGVKYASNDIEGDFFQDNVANGGFFDVEVEYVGPYFGGAYALPIADAGFVVLSGSVTYLFGETKVDAENNGVVENVTIKGESIGSNLGVAWSGNLGPLASALSRLGYSIGVDYSAYEFSDDGVDEFSEKTVRGKFDLKVRF